MLKTVYNATCKQIVQITRKLRVEREAVSILIETALFLRKMKTIEVIKWNKNVRLFPAVLATGIMSFGVLIETAMNVTFPTLTKEFGVSTGTVQWVTTIYLLVISIMVPLSNYLLKTYSLRRLFIVANLFF